MGHVSMRHGVRKCVMVTKSPGAITAGKWKFNRSIYIHVGESSKGESLIQM